LHELSLTERLRAGYDASALKDLYGRYVHGESENDAAMRRAIWRALARQFGHGVRIGRGALFVNPETFDIGDGVFIGDHAILQGRLEGTCVIASHVWIGPQSYFDARHLTLEEHVGWGPGAKVLGSMHTGLPPDVPIIQTDLEIKPVRVSAWADVGVNAVVLPGVTIGKGAIVGAGAVVTRDVAPFSVVAGVPARFMRWRDGHQPK
jgi:acetyltransferase-like isoleucine patch superfamily enzyme